MSQELRLLGEIVLEKKFEIAKNVHEDRIVGLTEEELYQLKQVEEELINIRADFIRILAEGLRDHEDQVTPVANIVQWGKASGAGFNQRGVPLDEALKDTTYYRRHIWRVLKEEIQKRGMSVETVFEVGDVFDPLLDLAAHSFSLAYIQSYNDTLNQSRIAFLELSTPVVSITKGLAVLPLIGSIDYERANMLMERTLEKASQLDLSRLILDLSGVVMIDTMVADKIFKLIDALKLIGVDTILTGLHPEIAQTMVNLRLKINHLNFKGNLMQALSDLHKEGVI
jgi:rsbT co-antagonist protein RsbR